MRWRRPQDCPGGGTATYLTDGHINLAIIPIGPEREIEGNQLEEGINHFSFEVEIMRDITVAGIVSGLRARPDWVRN